MSPTTLKHNRSNPESRGLHLLLLYAAIVMFLTLLLIPDTAFADVQASTGGSSGGTNCANAMGTGDTDVYSCLPAGRWSRNIGTIAGRSEPYKGVLGSLANFGSTITSTVRNIMPNMLLQLTQVLWNSALALSQFAANFDVLDDFGSQLDSSLSTMLNNVLAGSIPATLIVLAIIGVVAAAGFRIGTTGEAVKRLVTSVLCVAALIVMSVGATQDAGKETPSPGSPWWVMSTINDSMNMIAVDLSFDDLNKNGNPNMMSYKHENGDRNCQDYLAAMHDQYDEATNGKTTAADTSAVTSALNQLWEETALRSWVTMQWGNPSAGPSSTAEVAANARQAYCHVLDLQAGTDTDLQAQLTNAELGTQIDSTTAQWLFTTSGWIDPWNTAVNKNTSEAMDRDSATYQTRAGVFWETCGSDGNNITARDGWSKLVNNLTDEDSGLISGNGGQPLRAGLDDSNLQSVEPDEDGADAALIPGQPSGAGDGQAKNTVTAVCKAVLGNEAFHNGNDAAPVDEDDKHSYNLSDAAMLGWWFDVPNVNATWNEANMVVPSNSNDQGVRTTLSYFYGGDVSRDTAGAFGTVIGAVINGIVGALLSLVLIISKLMMLLMVMFLVFAVIVNGFPFGEAPKNTLKNWFKTACGFCMMGMVYAVLGNIAVFICQMFLNLAASSGVGTFMYNIIAGCSLGFAMIAVGMFCSKVLKIGNPFSLHALMGMAGGAALYRGITRAGRRAAFGMMHSGWNRVSGKARSVSTARPTSRNGNSSSSESAQIQDSAADQQETIMGSLAPIGGYARQAKDSIVESASSVKGVFTGHQMRKAMNATEIAAARERDILRFGGFSNPDAVAKADRRANLRRVGNGLSTAATFGAGVAGVVAGAGAFAAKSAVAAARSKPLRDAAVRTAKVAATAGLAAAAFTNPITAPAGIALAGKAILGRDGRETIKGVTGGAVTLAKAAPSLARNMGQAFASSSFGRGMSDTARQFQYANPDNAVGVGAKAVADGIDGMLPTAPTGENPFHSSNGPDVADPDSQSTKVMNPLAVGVGGEELYSRTVTGADGSQSVEVNPLYTKEGGISRAGSMAFDSVERQYRAELKKQGLSGDQIETELDERANSGRFNRDAKAFYDQHLAPGQDMADKVSGYKPMSAPTAPTSSTDGDMRQAVAYVSGSKAEQLRESGASEEDVRNALRQYRDSGQMGRDAQLRNGQMIRNAQQAQAEYQQKLESFNRDMQRRQVKNPANTAPASSANKPTITATTDATPQLKPSGKRMPTNDMEGHSIEYRGRSLTMKGGRYVDEGGKAVRVDKQTWDSEIRKFNEKQWDNSQGARAKSMGYDAPDQM